MKTGLQVHTNDHQFLDAKPSFLLPRLGFYVGACIVVERQALLLSAKRI